MTNANFKSEDKAFNHIYDAANSLSVSSKFDYVGNAMTVAGFTKTHIIAVDENRKKSKIEASTFAMYIHYRFVTITK